MSKTIPNSMDSNNYDTLSLAVNSLTKEGFTENFQAEETAIKALYSKKEYNPNELKIVKTFRFDGMTNPQDDAVVFALEATDGTKGTLVMSYSAEHNQNLELIKQVK